MSDIMDDRDNKEKVVVDETAITIRGIEKDPPLCGKTEFGGRLEDIALTKKQEKMLAAAKVDSMLATAAPWALQTVIDIMLDEEVKDELRHRAATEILDRVLGKATQTVDSHVGGGINIKISPAGGKGGGDFDDLSG